MTPHRVSRDTGFTLLEVCVALLLLTLAITGAAQLFALAIHANASARVQTSTTILATQKMEQLRGLTWSVDSAGIPVSDTASDLSFDPVTGGGTGLGASPSTTLDSNTPGWVDFLNARGQWIGTGPTAPPTAMFIRRWAIAPLPEDPADARILQVLVTTVVRDRQARRPRMRLAGDALVTTILSRKAR